MKIENLKNGETSKKIYIKPFLLSILSIFIISIVQKYGLGIIGIIISVRSIFMTGNAYLSKKNFKFEIIDGYINYNYGIIDKQKIKIKVKNIYKIKYKETKLKNKLTIETKENEVYIINNLVFTEK